MPPEYDYSNPDNPSEVITLLQSAHEEHSYTIAGVKWNRVWTVPQLASNIRIDPNSPKQFLDKTAQGGSLGDLWDRASDLSEARAEKSGGIDPVSGQPPKNKKKKPSRDIIIG